MAHYSDAWMDGTIAAWGNDAYGQVSLTPAGTFSAVAAGDMHSVVIRKR